MVAHGKRRIEVPVKWEVAAIEVAKSALPIRIVRDHESVVLPVVILPMARVPTVRDVFDAKLRFVKWRDGRAVCIGIGVGIGKAFDAAHRAEVVIEAAILLHQDHEMIDGDLVADRLIGTKRVHWKRTSLERACRTELGVLIAAAAVATARGGKDEDGEDERDTVTLRLLHDEPRWPHAYHTSGTRGCA